MNYRGNLFKADNENSILPLLHTLILFSNKDTAFLYYSKQKQEKIVSKRINSFAFRGYRRHNHALFLLIF